MPTYRYGIPKRGEPHVEIEWRDKPKNSIVARYDNQEVATIENAQTLTKRQSFTLSNGSTLDLQLVGAGKKTTLHVVKDGETLGLLDQQPLFWVGTAARALKIWGWLQVFAGVSYLLLLNSPTSPNIMSVLVLSGFLAALGLFYVVAARFIQRLSLPMTAAALIVHTLYTLPAVFNSFSSPNPSVGIFIIVLMGGILFALVQAFRAIRVLNAR